MVGVILSTRDKAMEKIDKVCPHGACILVLKDRD